jgi:hypothetical protein
MKNRTIATNLTNVNNLLQINEKKGSEYSKSAKLAQENKSLEQ